MTTRLTVDEVRRLGEHPNAELQRAIHPVATRVAPFLAWGSLAMGATANSITAAWCALGVLMAALLAIGSVWSVLVVVVLHGLYVALDIVDGSVARIHGTGSPLGRYYDRLAHLATYPMMVGGIALFQVRSEYPTWLVGLTLLTLCCTVVFVAQDDLERVARLLASYPAPVSGRDSANHRVTRVALRSIGIRPMLVSYAALVVLGWRLQAVRIADVAVLLFGLQFAVVVFAKTFRLAKVFRENGSVAN